MGINYANSHQPCLWCIWNKSHLGKCNTQDELENELNKEWSIIDTNKGARTQQNAQLQQGQNGYINIPLIRSVEYFSVAIDMLHLFLRVVGVLYDHFVKLLQELEFKRRGIGLEKYPRLQT